MPAVRRLLPWAAVLALLTTAAPSRAEEAAATPATEVPAAVKRAGARDIFKELNLSKDQRAKVAEIRKHEAERTKALKADTALTAKERKQKQAALREETMKELRAVLSVEQFAKYEQALQERVDATGQKRGDKGGKKKPN